MLRVEKIIIARLVKRVKSGHALASASSRPEGSVSSIRLREVQFDDFAAVSSLKSRHKLKHDSLANWERLWKFNPAIEGGGRLPMGWALEGEEGIVGYIGNIPLRCFHEGKPLRVAATHGLVVQAGYRTYTSRLVSAYCRQKGVDLLLSTSAAETPAKIFEAFKAQPLPQADYRTALFWVFNARIFLKTMQKKLRVGGPLGTFGTCVGAPLVRAEQALRRRGPRPHPQRCEIRELPPSAIGDDFDAFWRKKLAHTSRLIADRSAETLRWYFDIPGDQRRPVVLRCDYGGRMAGYAVVVTTIIEGVMKKAWLVDMLVEDEESSVPRELLIAAMEYARRTKHDVFEVIGFPRSIRRVCYEWNPYLRTHSSYVFRATERGLHAALGSEEAWYATPYDGDAMLMPDYSSAIPLRANSSSLV